MLIIEKIIIDSNPPKNKNVLWMKPIDEAFGIYLAYIYKRIFNSENNIFETQWIPLLNLAQENLELIFPWYYGTKNEEVSPGAEDILKTFSKHLDMIKYIETNTDFVNHFLVIPSFYSIKSIWIGGSENIKNEFIQKSILNIGDIEYNIYVFTSDNTINQLWRINLEQNE